MGELTNDDMCSSLAMVKSGVQAGLYGGGEMLLIMGRVNKTWVGDSTKVWEGEVVGSESSGDVCKGKMMVDRLRF